MESEEPISHPPPAESHNLQTKTCDPMAALQNSATRMISGENSRQICSFTTDRGFTIGHPADELLLYRIPMFTARKKKLHRNHYRCSGLRMEFTVHLYPMPVSHLPQKFCRWNLETSSSRASGPRQRLSWDLSVMTCKHARPAFLSCNPGGCRLSQKRESRRALRRSGLGIGTPRLLGEAGRIRSFWMLALPGLACVHPV